MTARMFTCPGCFARNSFSDIQENKYACLNRDCILSERLCVHSEILPTGQATKLYGWVLEPGDLLHGKYEVVKLIGKGGYGATYEAHYRELQLQTFAIKETPRVYCDNEEDEFLLNLNHPGIPKLFERFNNGDLHYIVMEYIEGEDLQALISNRPGVGLEQLILKVAEQVCDVLAYIHSEGVIHRDLKPENILVRRNGSIAIVDFGIAKRFVPGVQTRHLARAASHFYSPPEQHDPGKGNTEPRSDIYSLGAILYFLFTGRDPIDAVNRKDGDDITPLPSVYNPNISRQMEEVIIKAMSMNPAKRFATMNDFRKILIQAGAVSTRVCPNCGRLYRGSKNSCQDCGSPTSPLGAAQDAPFVFRSGEKAATLQEFVNACYKQWDDALWHLYQGDFIPWLNSIQEGALAERAANIQRLMENRNLGLNQFLMSTAFGRSPKLELSHTKIDFLSLKPGVQKRLVFTIYNPGSGYLQGDIQINSPHLSADNYFFSCFSGESKHITLTVTTENIKSHRTLKTSVILETNVGSKNIPVTITTEIPAVTWKVAPSSLIFKLLPGQTDVKGFAIEVTTSHGKLTGSVASSQPWVQLRPLTFTGRSRLIRVEINSRGLAPASYQTSIEVKTNFGQKNVDVDLSVVRPEPPRPPKPLKPQKPSKPTARRRKPPWKSFFSSQFSSCFFFIILMLLIHLFHPGNSSMSPDSATVAAFLGLGALLGLSQFVQTRLYNKPISLLIGILSGLIASILWRPVSYFVENIVQVYIIQNICSLIDVTPSISIEYMIFGFTGLLIGGTVGLFKNAGKHRATLFDLFTYLLIFMMLVIFLAFAFTAFLDSFYPSN